MTTCIPLVVFLKTSVIHTKPFLWYAYNKSKKNFVAKCCLSRRLVRIFSHNVDLIGGYSGLTAIIQAPHVLVNAVTATGLIVTRVAIFTKTSGHTHQPVIHESNTKRTIRTNWKQAARVSVECPLVDDDVFRHNLIQLIGDELIRNYFRSNISLSLQLW